MASPAQPFFGKTSRRFLTIRSPTARRLLACPPGVLRALRPLPVAVAPHGGSAGCQSGNRRSELLPGDREWRREPKDVGMLTLGQHDEAAMQHLFGDFKGDGRC